MYTKTFILNVINRLTALIYIYMCVCMYIFYLNNIYRLIINIIHKIIIINDNQNNILLL